MLCNKRQSFTDLSPDEKRAFEDTCGVRFPCRSVSDCERSYETACPRGWYSLDGALSTSKLAAKCPVFLIALRWLNLCGAAGVPWQLQPAARQCSSSQQASKAKTGSGVRCGVPVPGRPSAVTRAFPRYKVHSNTSCAVVPLVSSEWSHSVGVKGCSSCEF